MASTMSSLLLLLLLCLSMHACTGLRRLRIKEKESGSRQDLLSNKDLEKSIHDHDTTLPVTLIPKVMMKHILSNNEQEEPLDKESGPMDESEGGIISTQNPIKNSKDQALCKDDIEEESKEKNNSGSGIAVSMGESAKIEGIIMERRARSMLRSSHSRVTKENIETRGNNANDADVVVMDYEQAHRKPPIHNLSP